MKMYNPERNQISDPPHAKHSPTKSANRFSITHFPSSKHDVQLLLLTVLHWTLSVTEVCLHYNDSLLDCHCRPIFNVHVPY